MMHRYPKREQNVSLVCLKEEELERNSIANYSWEDKIHEEKCVSMEK